MNPNVRYILVAVGILASFALVAALITLTLPHRDWVSDIDSLPTFTPTTLIIAPPTATKIPTPTLTPIPPTATATPIILTPTPIVGTLSPRDITQIGLTMKGQSIIPKDGPLASPVAGGNGVPAIEEKAYLLPEGVGPSEGARNCPNPLPLAQIREDYLNYWAAVQKAHKEANFEILKPFLDPTSRDGQFLAQEKNYVDQMRTNGYFIEYQIIHNDPLKVKINPQSAKGICYVLVIDAAQVTAFAKKTGTNQPVNDKQPVKYQYGLGHGYMMTPKNDHWIVSNEGADSDQ